MDEFWQVTRSSSTWSSVSWSTISPLLLCSTLSWLRRSRAVCSLSINCRQPDTTAVCQCTAKCKTLCVSVCVSVSVCMSLSLSLSVLTAIFQIVQSSSQIITTNKPTPSFLQAGCPSCRPTNGVKALNGKISHSMDLLTPSSPGGLSTLSLTTNSSWLPWGRVVMPLISPLMPVPHKSKTK